MAGRRLQRWSCFQVSAKKKGRVTSPQLLYVRQDRKKDGKEENRPSAYRSTQKPSRNTYFQGGNPEVGCCPWSSQSWNMLNQDKSFFGPTSHLIPCGVRFACTDCSQCWNTHLIYACSNHDCIKPNYFWNFSAFSYPNTGFTLWKAIYFCFVILLVKLLVDGKRSCSQSIGSFSSLSCTFPVGSGMRYSAISMYSKATYIKNTISFP